MSMAGLQAAESLPAKRTLTDKSGKSLAVTILSAEGTMIKVRRTSDGKDVTINAATLSPADQQFVSTLPQGDPPAISNKSSIKVDVVSTETSASGTPVFERGADMTDAPAVIRIARVQTNVDDPTPVSRLYRDINGPLQAFTKEFPVQKKDPVKFQFFAEVWQEGKIVCKSYKTNKKVESLPAPSTEDKPK